MSDLGSTEAPVQVPGYNVVMTCCCCCGFWQSDSASCDAPEPVFCLSIADRLSCWGAAVTPLFYGHSLACEGLLCHTALHVITFLPSMQSLSCLMLCCSVGYQQT